MRIELCTAVFLSCISFNINSSPYSYEFMQVYSLSSSDIFGSSANVILTFDNGNHTNITQSYTWGDVTGMEIVTNGGIFNVTEMSSNYEFRATLNDSNNVLLTTDYTGENGLFTFDTNVSNHITILWQQTINNPYFFSLDTQGDGWFRFWIQDMRSSNNAFYLNSNNSFPYKPYIVDASYVPESAIISEPPIYLLLLSGLFSILIFEKSRYNRIINFKNTLKLVCY